MRKKIIQLSTLLIALVPFKLYGQLATSGSVTGNEVINHPRFQNNYFLEEQSSVDLSTGSIKQTIPLITLSGRQLSTSISISYEGRGIKVNDIPGIIGLGWELMVGGYIKREVRHIADESRIFKKIPETSDFDGLNAQQQILKLYNEFYDIQINKQGLYNGWLDYPIENNLPFLGSALPVTVDKNSTVANRIKTEVTDKVINNTYPKGVHYLSFLSAFGGPYFNDGFVTVDSQPDIFHFNLNGITGSFVFDTEGNPVTIPEQDIKIIPGIGPKGGADWIFILPNGTKYIFENSENYTEKTNIIADNTPLKDDWKGVTPRYDEGKTFSLFTSAWLLTRIETPNGEKINFTYETDPDLIYENKDHVRLDYFKSTSGSPQKPDFNLKNGNYEEHERTNKVEVKNRKKLTGISSALGSVTLKYSPVENGVTKGTSKLDWIEMYDLSGLPIRKFVFDYGNFLCDRLKLESLREEAGDKISLPIKFLYNTRENLPCRNNPRQDYWGYNNNNTHPSLIPEVIAYVGLTGKSFAGAKKAPDENKAQANILKEIVWPGGAHTVFQYSLNSYYNENAQQNTPIGGLRISQIINYTDKNKTNGEIIQYSYHQFDENNRPISTGTSTGLARQHEIQRWNLQIGSGDGGHDTYAFYVFRTSNSRYDLYLDEPVRYSSVTIEKVDLMGNKNGKTVYHMTDFKTNPDIDNAKYSVDFEKIKLDNSQRNSPTPAAPKISRAFERGLMKRIVEYDKQGTIVKEKENFFDFNVSTNPKKIYGYLSDSDDKFFHYGEYLFHFNVEIYYHDAKNYVLKRVEEKTYLPEPVSTTKTFEYHPQYHSFLKSETEVLSDKSSIKTTYTYAADKVDGPYDQMKELFIVNPVCIVETFKDSQQIAGEKTHYGDFGNNNFLPSVNELWDTENNYFESTSFLKYDDSGNIIELKDRAGLAYSYKWAYNNAYKVAESKNANTSNIFYTSFEEEEENGIEDSNAYTGKKIIKDEFNFIPSDDFTPSPNSLLTYWVLEDDKWILKTESYSGGEVWIYGDKIDELRIYPKDAELITWTYSPLVGQTSKTDSNGQAIYYEYDGLGRLKVIRDSEKNIIKHFDYQFKRPVR